ncbi:unnamed protein product [Lymnaea stagnalis]|uniref:RNA polymerase II subunit B1 CTD phosphatase RPAP2 homolog n=1 Tax=Lymnaea stagnalis TaxID=6523 RepID=A0AAV2IHA1_LYMST
MGDKLEKMKIHETTVRHRVECEERAFHIVNKLIDGSIDEEYLIHCGRLISREHYSDIIDERAITLLCGYPLCGNSLENIPKKKYHISTRTNKVYDISERKNFCSNQCLKASKHFHTQIPESPLWSRERELDTEIVLLPNKNIKGILGDEVVGESPKKLLKEELLRLEELDKRLSPSNKESPEIRLRGRTLGETPKQKLSEKVKTGKDTDKLPCDGCITNVICDQADANRTDILACEIKNLTISDGENGTMQNEALNEKMVTNSVLKLKGSESLNLVRESETCQKNRITESPVSGDDETKTSHGNVTDRQGSSVSQSEGSKMDQLMKLLAKKKSVLSAMVDVQPLIPTKPLRPLLQGTNPISLQCPNVQSSSTVDASGQENQGEAIKIPLATSDVMVTESGSSEKPVKSSNFSNGGTKNLIFSPLQRICPVLKSWVSEDTYMYIFSKFESKETPMSFSDPKIKMGYADLCKRLDMQQKDYENIVGELDGATRAEETKGKNLKATPDYEALKKEAEAFQLKVTEFLTGKRPQDKGAPDKQVTEDDDADHIILPSVDAYNQQQIRMKIVLYQLDKSLPNLLTPLALSVQDVSTLIRELVFTFRLQKDNILFKPSEWMIVAIFILKMLSRKSRPIAMAFHDESATKFFSILLKGIGHTTEDLEKLTDEILESCHVQL